MYDFGRQAAARMRGSDVEADNERNKFVSSSLVGLLQVVRPPLMQRRRNRGGSCPRCPCTGAHGGREMPFPAFIILLHLHQNRVIHKRRIDEVSAKEVAKEFVEIKEQRRIYYGQFE